MDSSVESIMTGEVQIESVLKANKEKIQSLTKDLELIIRKGYFEIIRNTEILQSLSPSNSIPKIEIPSKISFDLPEPVTKPATTEETIWDLLNQNQFIEASELILNTSSPSAWRIGKLLKSPDFFNVFDLELSFLERISSFLRLEKPENESIETAKFLTHQLKNQTHSNFDEIFEKCRVIFNSFIKPSEEVPVQEIVENDLYLFFTSVKEKLLEDLSKIVRIEDLKKFVSSYSARYGIPTVWDLVSKDWEATARKLIFKNCEFLPFATLQETLIKFEEKTRPSVDLLSSSPALQDSLKSDLCLSLVSSIPPETSPVLQFAFLSHLSELSLFKLLDHSDFSSYLQELREKIAENFKSKDILQVCIEIRRICAEKMMSLDGVDLQFGPGQSGFGRLVGLSPSQSFSPPPALPAALSQVNLLALPIALSTHLLLN
jgi:hypothetical protein